LPLYDAHNHLQDERFAGRRTEIVAASVREGVTQMVVNGSCEDDWPQVLALARAHPQVLPAFGYHPWYLRECSAEWEKNLKRFLDEVPGAVGEIGLDRWKPGIEYDGQEEVFLKQLRFGAERDLPVSIHCLQAWGRLHSLLRENPRPRRGFLLHSYGGPAEMVVPLARLGAYFSFSGAFAHHRKVRQRETFKHVPPARLLIETDAPDQLPPTEFITHPLIDPATRKPINHPANLEAIYQCAAQTLGTTTEELAPRVAENFLRLFGGI
jgi:TatD DNase family protein